MENKKLALIAIFISLSVALRVFKNMLTTLQFINIPLVFTMFSGVMLGCKAGLIVGLFSYTLSDMLILLGPWTIVNSLLAGVIGLCWGMLRKIQDQFLLGLLSFLSIFIFDVFSSVILYIVFGLDVFSAFIYGFLGLFIPVVGGGLVGVGPLTELSSTLVFLFFLKIGRKEVEKYVT